MNDNNLFQNAFDAIDDELIAEAKSPAIYIATRRKKIIISSIAACVAAVIVAIPSIKILGNINDNNFTTSEDKEIIIQEVILGDKPTSSEPSSSEPQQEPDTPSKPIPPTSSASKDDDKSTTKPGYNGIDDISIKMEDLSLINTSIHGPSITYEKVYSPSIEHLNIEPIPTKKTIAIYENYYEKELDFNEALSISESFFNNFAKSLNITVPQYDTKIGSTISIKSVYDDNLKYRFEVRQSTNRNILNFTTSTGSANICGKEVTINGLRSDSQIINSLAEIKKHLFNIYGVEFADTKIIREYDDYTTGDPLSIEVLFYNDDGHELNRFKNFYPHNDFISLLFINHRYPLNPSNVQKGNYLLYSIIYNSYRTVSNSDLRVKFEKQLIPLEKAEKFLQKGYALSIDDSFSQYQFKQTNVDFTNYDYVSFEYAGGNKIGDLTLPYYSFYKNIGTSENGNMIFAKAYVPAIEVEDYEEYFISINSN